MDFSNFTFRSSSLGHIMQDAKGKSNKELYDEYNLEYTEAVRRLTNPGASQEKTLAKLYDRSLWLSAEIDRLEPIQDVPHLSDSCKTHLADIYTVVKYGRTTDLKSKYLEKGLLLEEDAITLYCEVYNTFHKKNKERKYNAWIEGECDIDAPKLDLIVDTKVNWDIFTFNRVVAKPIKPLYHWQGDGYMWLYGRKNFELAYCLLNTPEHLIKREEKKLMYEMFGSEYAYTQASEDEKMRYAEACDTLRHNMIYDDIPKEDRIRIFKTQYSEARIEKIKKRVEECRIWLNNFAQGKIDVDNEE